MKLIVAALLALASTLARAQPACYPILDADKVYPPLPIVYRDGVGAGVGWYCKTATGWSSHWYFGTYSQIGTDYHAKANAEAMAVFKATDQRAAANATYTRIVTGPIGCDVQPTTALKTLCNSVKAEVAKYPPPAPPPPPTWAVKPNNLAADKSRPVYLVVTDAAGATKLGASTGTRAAAGSPCDCATKVATTASVFCGVNGRLDQVAACEAKQ